MDDPVCNFFCHIAASKLSTKHHVELIKCQSTEIEREQLLDDQNRIQQSIKNITVNQRQRSQRMDSVDASLSPDVLCLVMQSRGKGASSWPNVIPVNEQGLALNKQEIGDSL